MSLPNSITMTKDGGFYYRAMAFRHLATWLAMPFVLVVVTLAVVNPLWFRDSFFRLIENHVNRYARWRNYKQYAIYLGTDPEVWHTLKG